MNKVEKQKSIIVSLISILVIEGAVLALSVIYNFNGGFYYSRVAHFNKVLGEDLVLEIDGVGVDAVATNFTGTTLLNCDIKQVVKIETTNLAEPLFLRAKFEVSGMKDSGIMFGYTNWVLAEDGYLYFNQAVSSNERIGLCQYVNISENVKLDTNKNYVALFLVESSVEPWANNIQDV